MGVAKLVLLLALAATAQAQAVGGNITSASQGTADEVAIPDGVGSCGFDQLSAPIIPDNATSYFGPVVRKTLNALQALYLGSNAAGAIQLTGSANSTVTISRTGPFTVFLAFESGELGSSTAGVEAVEVPFLSAFVGSSLAGEDVVSIFTPWSSGDLAAAISEVLQPGETLLHVVSVGSGHAGRLAYLGGAWAGLTYPAANSDVVTFGTPWDLMNPQFAWSYNQLLSLYYHWPYTACAPAANLTASQMAAPQGAYEALGNALTALATQTSLVQSTTLSNLPPELPADWSRDTGRKLRSLGPAAPPLLEPVAQSCPPVLCKAAYYLTAACSLWPASSTTPNLLGDIPLQYMSDASNGAGAVVAWDESTRTAIFIWESTQNVEDFIADLKFLQTSDFQPTGANVISGVQVEDGFYDQYASLTTGSNTLLDAFATLSNNATPVRVVCAGHSLGSAVASLLGVWASGVWPSATVTVAGSGTPMVENQQWTQEFRAVVGRSYRFVYEQDLVPSLPPFNSYQMLDGAIWLRQGYAIATERPPFDIFDLSIEDHFCIKGYVPDLNSIANVTVPQWIYSYNQASYVPLA
ncbi:hypothetical protein H632_c853p0 [Helicosporidium sp. ATCC 50920]|nr:hypothetical protein H632_c853p0 [Helicosporidium sp. ATCC 50920]|eukprot:KDD75131.1 hypothetical protein H632_c853p0 [Helicosporidium sp. ATCC 50920]